jgi:hypothetical protein
MGENLHTEKNRAQCDCLKLCEHLSTNVLFDSLIHSLTVCAMYQGIEREFQDTKTYRCYQFSCLDGDPKLLGMLFQFCHHKF